jgi:alpha-N-acetylglucosamine transferase
MLSTTTRKLLAAILVFFLITSISSSFRSSVWNLSWPASIRNGPGNTNAPKRAFATFYSTRIQEEDYDDPYFTATRTLLYQLLHQPNTRTKQGIPLLVIVPHHVSEARRQIFRNEGAIVVPVDSIKPSSWTAHPMEDRWIDQFTKLQMFSMTEYDRILYMDSDTLLTRPLDGIWEEDSVALPQKTKLVSMESNSVKLPVEYVIAGAADNERAKSNRPTPVTPHSRLNAGFLVFKPDQDLYAYYLSILQQRKSSFDDRFMEMGLLNQAHKRRGPMPWASLPSGQYSNNWPQLVDVENGSATLHDKFWTLGNKDWIDRELVEMWWRVQGRMEGYWQGKGHPAE